MWFSQFTKKIQNFFRNTIFQKQKLEFSFEVSFSKKIPPKIEIFFRNIIFSKNLNLQNSFMFSGLRPSEKCINLPKEICSKVRVPRKILKKNKKIVCPDLEVARGKKSKTIFFNLMKQIKKKLIKIEKMSTPSCENDNSHFRLDWWYL